LKLNPFFVSILVAVPATIFTFFVGIAAAYRVARARRFKGIMDGLFTLPLVLPPTVVGFFLILLFGKNGLAGNLLASIGASVVFTRTGAVIAASVVSFPLMYRASRGAFEQVDIDLINAARTLGMSELVVFTRVVLPNCWPGVASGAILSFTRALGEFGATSMLAGNIPGKTQTMSLAIYSAVSGNNREKAYVWVAIVMCISFITIALMNLFTGRADKRGVR
jgi:molybdate transport system permease protein